MSKFQVGEIAVLTKNTKPGAIAVRKHSIRAGDEVTIFRVGPFRAGARCTQPNVVGAWTAGCDFDYEVHHPSGFYFFCQEYQLRKRRPPGADIVREFMHELPREVMA